MNQLVNIGLSYPETMVLREAVERLGQPALQGVQAQLERQALRAPEAVAVPQEHRAVVVLMAHQVHRGVTEQVEVQVQVERKVHQGLVVPQAQKERQEAQEAVGHRGQTVVPVPQVQVARREVVGHLVLLEHQGLMEVPVHRVRMA